MFVNIFAAFGSSRPFSSEQAWGNKDAAHDDGSHRGLEWASRAASAMLSTMSHWQLMTEQLEFLEPTFLTRKSEGEDTSSGEPRSMRKTLQDLGG